MKRNPGKFIRKRREALREKDPEYSLRRVAGRIGVEPSHLSKIEQGKHGFLSEYNIYALADELHLHPDDLLSKFGKIAADVRDIFLERPRHFGALIRALKRVSDEEIEKLHKLSKSHKIPANIFSGI